MQTFTRGYVHISKQHEVVRASLKVDPGACVLPEDPGLPLRLGVVPTSPSERWCLQMAFTTSPPKDLKFTLWQINIDPEHHQCLMETSLPTPTCQGLC